MRLMIHGSSYGDGSTNIMAHRVVVMADALQCVEWSLGIMTSGAQRLRELERTAKQEKRGIWTNYVAPPTNQVCWPCGVYFSEESKGTCWSGSAGAFMLNCLRL
jgi:hypothetical protein